MEKYCRVEQATDDSMGHAHNATNTFSEYATLIAFPLEQWLHDRIAFPLEQCLHDSASVLRCTYIVVVFLSVRDGISQP